MPAVLIVGAPGTGVPALHAALQAHGTGTHGAAQHILSSEGATLDGPLLQQFRAGRQGAITLLMGLDLPCPATDRPAQEAEDGRLRAALAEAGVAFHVVYGVGAQRVAHALSAIKNEAARAYPASARGLFDLKNDREHGGDGRETADRPVRLRAWSCEKCSDPECEHRLFTSLPGRPPRAG